MEHMRPFLFSLLLAFSSPCFASPVAILTTSLPNGTVETRYSAVIATTGGCAPFKWAVVSGALPPGIAETVTPKTTALDLGGTPTEAATYSFTVSVTACGGHVSTTSYKVTIQAAEDHVVDLNWKASTSSDIAGYNVYRSPDGSTWEKMNASLIASTLYSDSAVANGSTYYYAATSVNISGEESSRSAEIKVVIP
jgi:large repetitive protein